MQSYKTYVLHLVLELVRKCPTAANIDLSLLSPGTCASYK